MGYLESFHAQLEKRARGSLISVREAEEIQPNAKKYLAQLAGKGQIEKVTWGWYWIPARYKSFFNFLAKEKHFKALQKQTAAGVWNGDFVHRDHYTVAVSDPSYARALKAFTRSRGWNLTVETRDFASFEYVKVGELYVETLEETIVDCLKEWAFVDAFASLYENYDSIAWNKISRHAWERIQRSNARVGQVLRYGSSIIGQETANSGFPATRANISDSFVRRQVDEAARKVAELG